METSKITYTAKYEIVIHYSKGVELGFFADKMPNEEESKTTFIRVEHGEPDACHGLLTLDFKKMLVYFGYDVLYVEKPFKVMDLKDDGTMVFSADRILITIKEKK